MERERKLELITEIDDYLARRSTTLASSEMRLAVDPYFSDHAFDEERNQIFRRYPLIVAQHSQVPNPHDFVTVDIAGTSLLIVRQPDNSLKAMRNTCRHRGAKVCAAPSGNQRAFTCPYHAWSYRADGSLRAIPHDEGFPNLDRTSLGLPSIPIEERHGLIWVVLDEGATIDVRAHLGAELDDEFTSYGLGAYYRERETVLHEPINWKMVIDGFLETYHVKFLHSKTIGPWVHGNLAPYREYGRHGVIVGVRATYDDYRKDVAGSDVDLMAHISPTYRIFPNSIVVSQQDHFEIWNIHPDGPHAATCHVWLLAKNGEPVRTKRWDSNWKIVLGTVLNEDFPVARTIQQAFESHSIQSIVIGRNEPGLQHFHRELQALRSPS